MKAIDFGSPEEFIENYERLKSSRKMGELYNCDHGTVLNYAKKIGYNSKKHKEIKITNIPISQVIEEYEELLSCKKVGELHGCSGTAVQNYLRKNNYNLENHTAKLRNVSPEDFINDYNILKSAKKMGEKYNCSPTAILNYANKINYDPNSNKIYKLTKEDKQYIIDSYNFKTSNELAKELNVNRGLITRVWFNNNLIGKKIISNHTAEIDITNKQYGLWTVLYKTEKRNSAGIIYWHCRCQCGIEKDVLGTSLRQGLSLSCGAHPNISKGNEKIKILLQEANIPFEIEKKFPTCKDKKELPFDFYVNNDYLIEYDGSHHFKTDTIFDYNYTHNHDIIKSNWCKQNYIPLIRIPYTHFDELKLEDLLLETSSFLEL